MEDSCDSPSFKEVRNMGWTKRLIISCLILNLAGLSEGKKKIDFARALTYLSFSRQNGGDNNQIVTEPLLFDDFFGSPFFKFLK